MKFQVYCVNLPHRVERKAHIISEFRNYKEFELHIVNAVPATSGNVSLWQTFISIIANKINRDDEFFIFCEDDHAFTNNFNFDYLRDAIETAQKLNADILSGGVSWFRTGIQISKHVFWVEKFSGLQFTVVFKKIYSTILNTAFLSDDKADYKLSEISNQKFVMYPFISVQKEFGYSDITEANNKSGWVSKLFKDSEERFSLLREIKYFYLNQSL